MEDQWPALRHGGVTWLWDSTPGIRHEKAKMSPQTQVWASPAHSPSSRPSAIRGGDFDSFPIIPQEEFQGVWLELGRELVL